MASFLQTEITDPSFHKLETPAWLEHGPFAMWLVKKLRPRRIVELGTHYGYSYFAMCEAVAQAGLDTQCVAVDTWVGEEHSGRYGAHVFESVVAENRKYAHFSTLLRKTFAEARADIADGSVDLLHVDGRHFYDDVKEDHEIWIPKLSDRAVVLFHDTMVRERGFGVHRYWAELAARHPSFNFSHGHGLGVLFRGDGVPPELTELVGLSGAGGGPGVVEDFFQLAGGIAAERFRARADRQALEAELAEARRAAADLHAQAETLATENDAIQIELDEAGGVVTELTARTRDLAGQLGQVAAELRQANADLARARRRPLRTFWDFLRFRVLTGLSKASPPLPARMARRLGRSGAKRDPNRSLVDPAALSVRGSGAVYLPVATASNFTTHYAGRAARKPDRPDILIVSHDASRTGAPILTLNLVQSLSQRYNVTTLCLRGGGLLDDFAAHSVAVREAERPTDGGPFYTRVLDDILPEAGFAFAVVNSIESRHMLAPLKARGIPSVALLHEFASYTLPGNAFAEAMFWADKTVFSTRLTLENAVDANHLTRSVDTHVIPQGKCRVPAQPGLPVESRAERDRLRSLLRPEGLSSRKFIVIGAGYVQIRKGVDLFIDTAMRVLQAPETRDALFVWIGAGYDPKRDSGYSVYLQDQMMRAGIADRVLMLPETPEIETVYGLADAFLVASRLDPLPNVAIDAMCTGLPVFCFARTTGIADTLTEAGLSEHCVAPYLDTRDMASKLVAFAGSEKLRADIAERTRAHAATAFDFDGYAGRIEALALSDSPDFDTEAATILDSGRFDPDFFCVAGAAAKMPPEAAVRQYLASARKGVWARKPEPGFHPYVFARHMADAVPAHADSYAEFLRRGRPEGTWMAQVIRGGSAAAVGGPAPQRSALHVHAYYTDQLQDVVRRLDGNLTRPDLYVSVADAAGARAARRHLAGYSGTVADVSVVPNAGRDIGPLLTRFGPELVRDYEVIGHVHTKKSAHVENAETVRAWVEFLYSGVLGGGKAGPMMDRVLHAMQGDSGIGVVYPDDPTLMGWTRNLGHAQDLARRMGFGSLPDAFNFPIGTMFWMRNAALEPFVDLGLAWSDYPNEPAPNDGTMLHALERLFGIVPVLKGWTTAVTHTPGISR
ncbi:rhamnan synthesis F family protein [Meridianimarinicoccus sp. RP-17]|uniref:rhamnan synthesis F family protein n=1 Tax=Meridianimarinicoccus zhengii TaxID=2056810 RepID=UPI000DACDD8E|nr:rhamnan synthesis F family protein [Phycocomes zhengii]